MTRPDELNCLHEPFAEPFYFGPERMAERYTNGLNEERRLASGHAETTYFDIMEKVKTEHDKVGDLSFDRNEQRSNICSNCLTLAF